MKVLHLIATVNPRSGGPIEFVRAWSLQAACDGHEMEVASMDDPGAPWARAWASECAIKAHALGPSRGGYSFAPRAPKWLEQNARGYDALIAHGLWQHPTLAARRASRASGVPYFVYPHGMLDPWFGRAYPLKHLKKLGYWAAIERRVLRQASGVLFACEEEKRLARLSFPGYACHEIVASHTVAGPPGSSEREAHVQREAFLDEFPALRGKRLLLFLSRIHPKKGCDLLLDAFAFVAAREPELHLVMAGPDQVGWRPALQEQARSLGIEARVTWTGMLSGAAKWGAFRSAEAFVLFSHQENFGIAIAEALSCGAPALISDKVNIWREIVHSRAGLAAPDTREGARLLLEQWLSMSEPERSEMKRSATRCFEERFEIGRASRNLLGLLEARVQHRAQ